MIIGTLICQVTIFFMLLGTFMAFSSEIKYGKNDLERIYENKAIYKLLDGYFDPDEFTKFREQKSALDVLKKYYNKLNTASNFKYLAMFNQKIIINNFMERIPQATEGKINSFQINKQAHDYFNLAVSKGRPFSLEDFKDNGNIIPVLMGSNYGENFSVGDRIEALYYQKEVTLEVVGILQQNTFLYFNGDSEFYLDNNIVLPYIDYNEPKTDFEEWFQEIVYFAMINGHILIEIGDEFANNMMTEVEIIAQETGFYNYLFIGANPNIQPYRGLINVINSNYSLVKWLFAFSFCLNVITICLQLYLMQKRRLPALAVHYLNGASLSNLIKQFSCEILTIILIAFVLNQIVLNYILKVADAETFIFLGITAIVLTFCISIFPIYKLIKFELISLINSEEEHS